MLIDIFEFVFICRWFPREAATVVWNIPRLHDQQSVFSAFSFMTQLLVPALRGNVLNEQVNTRSSI